MPMLRFSMGTCVMSRSLTTTVPETGSMKPVMVRRVVVLPQPDGPRKVKNSPSLTWTLMSCRAVKSPNFTTMSFNLIICRTPLFIFLLGSLSEGRPADGFCSANGSGSRRI